MNQTTRSTPPAASSRRFSWPWLVMAVPGLVLLLAALLLAALLFTWPAGYVSRGRIQLPIPTGGFLGDFRAETRTFEEYEWLLHSNTLRHKALQRLGRSGPADRDFSGKHDESAPIRVVCSKAGGSSVMTVEAFGKDPDYTRDYLDALLGCLMEFRPPESDGYLASLTQATRAQTREVDSAQAAWQAFQQTNQLALLSARASAASATLNYLNVRMAEFALDRPAGEEALAQWNARVEMGRQMIAEQEAVIASHHRLQAEADRLERQLSHAREFQNKLEQQHASLAASRRLSVSPMLAILESASAPQHARMPRPAGGIGLGFSR